jgi:rare lipoprotein A
MRPHLTGRAPRAAAAIGALLLGVGVCGHAAIASSPAPVQLGVARRAQRRSRSPRLRARLVHPNVLIGQDVALVGVANPAGGRRTVAVQALHGSRWVQVARAVTNPRGVFVERFWPHSLGRLALRLRASGVSAASTMLSARVATVYHEVTASWYGPGGVTACGEVLGVKTMGVANKTLPCGTMVTLRYRHRSVRVPVIDRGPYVAGRDYDLTYATRLALGAGGVSQIWASA